MEEKFFLSSHPSSWESGFIDPLVNKRAEVVRVYHAVRQTPCYPTYDHSACGSRAPQYVKRRMRASSPRPNPHHGAGHQAHCTRGIGDLEWAVTERLVEDPEGRKSRRPSTSPPPLLRALAASTLLSRPGGA